MHDAATELLQRTDEGQHDLSHNEKLLLGTLFDLAKSQPEALSEIAQLVGPEDFLNPRHQRIFGAMLELDMESKPYGMVELFERLGGPKGPVKVEYLMELDNFATQHGYQFMYLDYAQRIRETSERRRLENAAQQILSIARSGEFGNGRELFDRAEEILSGVEPRDVVKTGPVAVVNLLDDYLEGLHERYLHAKNGGVPMMGLRTKLFDLDRLWTGLKPRKYYVIAARPAMGKTAFLTHVLMTVADEPDTYCLMFSAEMAKDEEMINRLVANRAIVDGGKLQTGLLNEDEWGRVSASTGMISPRFLIDDTPNMSITYIKRTARKLRREIGPDAKLVIAVDYLQLIEGPKNINDDEYRLTSYVSKQLNNMKKELDATIIALSQLNRKLEDRSDKRPMQSDLRGSGQIEQDADLIAFLYRDEVYYPDSDRKNVVEVITSKQRAGKIGTVELVFMKQFGTFASLQRAPGA